MSTGIAQAIDARIKDAQDRQLFLATVVAVNGSTVQVHRNGQDAPDNTVYKVMDQKKHRVNDVVIVAKVGASYQVLGSAGTPGNSDLAVGAVVLPQHTAGTYLITVPDARTGSNGMIFVSPINYFYDATANRSVQAWVRSWTEGVSFDLEYNTAVAMAADWHCVYWIFG